MQCVWRGRRCTVPLWLTRWMRAYGSYGSCVVLTLATSYGQLAAITALRIAVLRQKQHFVKSTFSGSTVFFWLVRAVRDLYSSGLRQCASRGELHRRLARPCALNCVQTQTNYEYPIVTFVPAAQWIQESGCTAVQ